MEISFHPEATSELEAAADWYAERSPESARHFCLAVDMALANILSQPERFAFVDAHHQSSGVHGFPFQVVFRHASDRVYVLAIAHSKRRPGYWRNR